MHSLGLEVETVSPSRTREVDKGKCSNFRNHLVENLVNTDFAIQNRVVLLGDACHPTLPYQAQGAAMAVEDGAVLGLLLGKAVQKFSTGGSAVKPLSVVSSVLELYEQLRKSRTTLNVLGAVANRECFHLHDGPEQEERDLMLKNIDWLNDRSKWQWLDMQYQDDLLGFDATLDAEAAFENWSRDLVAVEARL